MEEEEIIEEVTDPLGLSEGEMEVILKYISQLDIPLDKLHDPYLAVSSQITDDLLKPDEQPIFSQAKDIYNDSLSEQKFLRSKPVCFIIFGKPGSGKTQLSKSIAASWNCVYINPHALLLEVLEQATDISLDILKTLDNGELVEDEITFQLLDERMKASDVEHHGYILDGFPVVDQSFMTITEQMEWITNRAYPPDFILNIKMTHEDNIYRRETQRLDPISGMILGKEIYDPDDNIPLLLQQQQQQSPSQQSPEEETKELKSDEGLADASDMFLPEDAERLVQQPEDMPDNPEADHQNYFTNSLPVIEDYIASFEQQYVMLLDANQPSDILHKQCLAKFELSGLSPAAYVHVLNKEQESDDIDGPTVFRTYCSKEIVSGQYTWKKSHWDRYCPVALYYGNIVKGKTEFAVGFLNKIYFLSSAEYFDMFIRNPRPYLLSPQPRPPCKLIVLGMPKTGKSSLCYLLAKKYNAKVIQMSYILKEVMECRRKEKYAEWLRLAIDRSIAAVRKNVELDFYEELAKREARMEAMRAHSPTESALDAAEEIIDELLENVEEQRSSSEKEFSSEGRSSSPEKEVLSEGQTSQTSRDVTEVDSKPKILLEVLTPANLARVVAKVIDDVIMAALVEHERRRHLNGPTPSEIALKEAQIKAELQKLFDTVDGNNVQVQEFVQKLMAEYMLINIEFSGTDEYFLMATIIHEIEKQASINFPGIRNGGWILDDFPSMSEHWQACFDNHFVPDNIICLIDTSDQWSYSMQLWREYQMINIKIQKPKDEEFFYTPIGVDESYEGATTELEVESELDPRFKVHMEMDLEELDKESTIKEEEGTTIGEEGSEKDSSKGGQTMTEETMEEETGKSLLSVTSSRKQKTPSLGEEMEVLEEIATPEMLSTISSSQQLEAIKEEAANQYQELLMEAHTNLVSSMDAIKSYLNIEPVTLPIENQTIDDLYRKTLEDIEKPFKSEAVECPLTEIEEDDANFEPDVQDEENEEEEFGEEDMTEEDPRISKKRQLGEVGHYCPVMLKEKRVLVPGRPEKAAKYENKTYYVSSLEMLEQFISQPEEYVPVYEPFQPPPFRICIIGVSGAGKTVYGRYLANKLKVYHISFREKLQELIIKRTKKKLGPRYEEDPDSEAEQPPPEEEIKPFDEPKEEPPKKIMSDDEEAIKNFFLEGSALSSELLSSIISPWWFAEPFRSKGFVLEGFPAHPDDIETMSKLGCLPEAMVILTLEIESVVRRLIPDKMARWTVRRELKMKKIAEKIEEAKAARLKDMAIRREELIQDWEERKANRPPKVTPEEEGGAEEEVEEEPDVEATLNEEFPPIDEEPKETMETEEDARDRYAKDISSNFDRESTSIEKLQALMDEQLVPCLAIDAGQRQHIVNYVLMRSLKNYISCRQSIFERVYPISDNVAKDLIESGYKQLSCLGYWDPVKLKEGNRLAPFHAKPNKRVACIYRQYVYFFSGSSNRDEFMKNPIYYLESATPRRLAPPTMNIIGPPKSGKSLYSKKLASMYGLVCISMTSAINNVLYKQPNSHLAKQIFNCLSKGLILPMELEVAAVDVAILDGAVQTHGYVLDGIPSTLEMGKLLTARGILPMKTIVLDLDMEECAVRGAEDRLDTELSYTQHNSPQILALKYQMYKNESEAIEQYFQGTYQNLCHIESNQSKWAVWNNIDEVLKETINKVHLYLENIIKDQAGSISGLCVTEEAFQERLGEFKEYCPVSLALHNELVDCSHDKTMDLVAEYQGKYYKMETKEKQEMFIKEPSRFVLPRAPKALPAEEKLPKKCDADVTVEVTFEYKGYCPVTYYEGKCRYEAITPGLPEISAEYLNKFYCFASPEKREIFMRLPDLYSSVKLSYKLPPKHDPLMINLLPNLGFMEQSLATPILRALVAVGNFKPKFPFLSPTQSALLYVAFHLKAFNHQKSEYIRKKYSQKLKKFEENCNLVSFLSDNMSPLYQPPEERLKGFSEKLETFFALKSYKQNSIWIA